MPEKYRPHRLRQCHCQHFFARGPRFGEAWRRSPDSDGRPFRRRRLRGERPPASGGQSAAADQGVVRLIRVGSGSKNAKDIHDIIEKRLDDKVVAVKWTSQPVDTKLTQAA